MVVCGRVRHPGGMVKEGGYRLEALSVSEPTVYMSGLKPRRTTPTLRTWRRDIRQQMPAIHVLSGGFCVATTVGNAGSCPDDVIYMTSVRKLPFGSCRYRHREPEEVVYGSGGRLFVCRVVGIVFADPKMGYTAMDDDSMKIRKISTTLQAPRACL